MLVKHLGLAAALVLFGLLGAARAGAQITLYEHNNFKGRSHTIQGAEGDLKRAQFNDITSSVVIESGRWQLCGDANFRGQCVILDAGRYASLQSVGLNDAMSSARPAGGGDARQDLVLYEHENYKGRSLAVRRRMDDLGDNGFNDVASSVVINSGRWQLCSEVRFRGQCITLDPGRHASLKAMGMNDTVSSARPTDRNGRRDDDRNDGGAP